MQFSSFLLLRIMYVLFVFRLYYFIYPQAFLSSVCCNKVPEADLTGFRVPGILEA